jgi:hypothetical protein
LTVAGESAGDDLAEAQPLLVGAVAIREGVSFVSGGITTSVPRQGDSPEHTT